MAKTNTILKDDGSIVYTGTWTIGAGLDPNTTSLKDDYATWVNSLANKTQGIIFKRTNNSGVAQIDIYDTTNQLTAIGNTTNASQIITNIADTSVLKLGMRVIGSGIPINAKILSIDSATQITLEVLATTTAASVALTFEDFLNPYRKETVAGNTASSAVISATITSNLKIGMSVFGQDIPLGARILTITSLNSFTMDVSATGTSPGIAIQAIDSGLVDLYIHTNSSPDEFVHWTTVLDSTSYDSIVINTGVAPVASGGTEINILGFLSQVSLQPSEAKSEVILTHADHVGYSEIYAVVGEDVSVPTEKIVTLAADGIITDFALTLVTDRAFSPTRFGRRTTAEILANAPIIWEETYDPDLTWGTNSPDFNDEIIDANGFFTVKYTIAPITGEVYMAFSPKADSVKLKTTLIQPNDGAGFVDLGDSPKVLDQAMELY